MPELISECWKTRVFLNLLEFTVTENERKRKVGVKWGYPKVSVQYRLKRQLLSQLLGAHLGRELEFLFGTGGDVGFGWYGWFSRSFWRGTLFYTLGRLDQLREPRLHGDRLKIIVARGRGTRGANATGRGPKRLADFFGPTAHGFELRSFPGIGASLAKSTCCLVAKSAALVKRVSSTNSCLYLSRNCKKAGALSTEVLTISGSMVQLRCGV